MTEYHSIPRINWGSFRGRREEKWGSFRGRYHFGGCTVPVEQGSIALKEIFAFLAGGLAKETRNEVS